MSSIGYSAEGLAAAVSTIAFCLTLSIGLGIAEVFTLSIVVDTRSKVGLPIAALLRLPRFLGIERCLKLTTVLG